MDRQTNSSLLEIGKYRHAKSGKFYQVIGVALHTETSQQMVIYKPLYETDHQFFVRPYDMFVEIINLDGEARPRFELVVSEAPGMNKVAIN